jgi:hypothetical protein
MHPVRANLNIYRSNHQGSTTIWERTLCAWQQHAAWAGHTRLFVMRSVWASSSPWLSGWPPATVVVIGRGAEHSGDGIEKLAGPGCLWATWWPTSDDRGRKSTNERTNQRTSPIPILLVEKTFRSIVGGKCTFSRLKAYLRATDHTSSNIIMHPVRANLNIYRSNHQGSTTIWERTLRTWQRHAAWTGHTRLSVMCFVWASPSPWLSGWPPATVVVIGRGAEHSGDGIENS